MLIKRYNRQNKQLIKSKVICKYNKMLKVIK